MHMMQEMGEYQTQTIGNPRDFWCYKDEDYMGFIGDMASARGGVALPATIPTRVFQRFRGLGH